MKSILLTLECILIIVFIMAFTFIFTGEPDLWDMWLNTAHAEYVR